MELQMVRTYPPTYRIVLWGRRGGHCLFHSLDNSSSHWQETTRAIRARERARYRLEHSVHTVLDAIRSSLGLVDQQAYASVIR